MNMRTLLFSLLAGALFGAAPAIAANMVGLPACTAQGQSMVANLSTTIPTNWQVTGLNASGPAHTTLANWTALPNNWIQPSSSASPVDFQTSGDYTYLIRFYIPCDPKNYASLSLTGAIAADNSFRAFVNGSVSPFLVCAGPNCYNTPANPTAFGNLAGSLVRGVNTIQIVVHNIDHQSGLAVSATLTARCGVECCLLLNRPIITDGNQSQ
jgi:hypothetical protein